MKTKLLSFVCAFCIMGLCACNKEPQPDVATVDSLDLDRYLGKWYEIARFDHKFERNLVGSTAEYSYRDDGLIRVVNSGYKNTLDGEFKQSEGKARRPNADEPGKLEVAFFGNFYGDYYVLELADDYRYALVGSKTDKYLWILSRTPALADEDYNFLMQRIKDRGYNADKLIWVEQKTE